ncbi:lipocalin / cytosolic fatty-acid binding protein [Opisthorchis viverrini]|uniref:Lipocalin / cytosolic fatty-acid binding protein n=1 Tax=Opisthorchis viverrini TaxID=6198 RepID=A0A1S8WQL3_OPIVI|nr:lipocalin / cytosolic fatty-acid binding protein [Opisthorchis viverrini]
MTQFLGTWKLKDSRNFDAILQKLGVNVVKRKLITSSKPEVTYTIDGNKMTIRTCSALKTTTITFEFGKEFEERTADDRTVMSTFTKQSESKITQVQKHPNSVTTTVREVSGNTLTATVTVDDVKAVNVYEKH